MWKVEGGKRTWGASIPVHMLTSPPISMSRLAEGTPVEMSYLRESEHMHTHAHAHMETHDSGRRIPGSSSR